MAGPWGTGILMGDPTVPCSIAIHAGPPRGEERRPTGQSGAKAEESRQTTIGVGNRRKQGGQPRPSDPPQGTPGVTGLWVTHPGVTGSGKDLGTSFCIESSKEIDDKVR